MNIMNVLIAVIGLVTEILAATKQTEYVHLQDLHDMNCKGPAIAFTMTSVVLIVCLAMCTSDTNCKSVFYRSSDRHCTGCDSYYTGNSTLVADSGTVYYVPLDGDPACNKPARHFRLCDGNGAGQEAHPTIGRIEIFYNRAWWGVCDDCWRSDNFCLDGTQVHNLNTICGTFGLSTNTMNIMNVLIAVIGLVTQIRAATKQTEYVHLRDLDDMICKAEDKAFTMTSVVPIVCMAKCTSDTNCKSVFYRSSDRHCTGCDSYFTEISALVADSGTVYYVPLDGDPACNKPARNFRLCDGNGAGQAHPIQGRIEIFYNQTWWAVCDDCWVSDSFCPNMDRLHNLNTICRTFGLSGDVIYGGDVLYDGDYFGTNTKEVLIDDVACIKTEDTILDCLHIGPHNTHNCRPYEAVGVKCN